MKNIVTSSWLQNHINDENITIIDCRFNIYNPEYGEKSFYSSHLQNSIFLDLNKGLSGIPKKHGGTRPLPVLTQFLSLLSKYGINKDTIVIGYDDHVSSSARLWLTLKYIGHKNCYLLDGGFQSWIKEGYPVTRDIIAPENSHYINATIRKKMFCDIEYIRQRKDSSRVVLIDSRDNKRFTGKEEKLYKKVGHIPGAINFPCTNNFKEEGFIKEKSELSKLWSWIKPYQEIILYCGSGIAASVNFLVLDELGYSPVLYLGGFSDWISYEKNIVETGDIL
jgi:thiosulfate/3-mercaptopyruvate sulfurtransferase